MHSFKAFAAAALLVCVSAKDYYIRPDSVDIKTREGWCNQQKNTCPLLCMQNRANGTSVVDNTCDAETLQWACVCSDNLTPNMTEFSVNLPFFICQEFGNQCQKNSCAQSDTVCQSNCRADNPCGAQDPERINATTTTSSAVSAATGKDGAPGGGGAVNGFADPKPTGNSGSSGNGKTGGGSSAAATAMDLGKSYGLAVLFTGLFAGFALVM